MLITVFQFLWQVRQTIIYCFPITDAVLLIFQVNPQQQMKNIRPKAESSVVVTILDSAPISVSVPAELEVDDPAFIQYVAQEALTLHKRQIRDIDSGSDVA